MLIGQGTKKEISTKYLTCGLNKVFKKALKEFLKTKPNKIYNHQSPKNLQCIYLVLGSIN